MTYNVGDTVKISKIRKEYEKKFGLKRFPEGTIGTVTEIDTDSTPPIRVAMGVSKEMSDYEAEIKSWWYFSDELSKYPVTNSEKLRGMCDEDIADFILKELNCDMDKSDILKWLGKKCTDTTED